MFLGSHVLFSSRCSWTRRLVTACRHIHRYSGDPIPGTKGIEPGPGWNSASTACRMPNWDGWISLLAIFAGSVLAYASFSRFALSDVDRSVPTKCGATLNDAVVFGAHLRNAEALLCSQLHINARFSATNLMNAILLSTEGLNSRQNVDIATVYNQWTSSNEFDADLRGSLSADGVRIQSLRRCDPGERKLEHG